MSITIKKGDISVTVETEDDLSLAQKFFRIAESNGDASKQSAQPDIAKTPTTTDQRDERPVMLAPDGIAKLRDLLLYLKGTKTAKFLTALKEFPNGCADHELRERIGMGTEDSWAGVFAAIGKQTKSRGLTRENILLTQQKRIRRGGVAKISYHYTLTDAARKVIDSIPKFDDEDEL